MPVEFEPWPKIARLNRDIIITEKIDGTNAAVVIVPLSEIDHWARLADEPVQFFDTDERHMVAFVADHAVFAQSRRRFIYPGSDNYGFAAWVYNHAAELVEFLGEGRHFGEWWGAGIQRGYKLPKGQRFFSLFNTSRWEFWDAIASGIEGLRVVPKLYEGPFSQQRINDAITDMDIFGSVASACEGAFEVPAEGIVVYHTAANTSFKVTLEGDEAPKGQAAHALDESSVL